jgi:hypothetical protein
MKVHALLALTALLLSASPRSDAGSVVHQFANDFAGNEIFLWMDPGAVTFSGMPTFGGTMADSWSTPVRTATTLRIGGPAVAAGSGRINVRFAYAGPSNPTPRFNFQWAEVLFNAGTNGRTVLGAGSAVFSAGSYSFSDTFTHLNPRDIPNLAVVSVTTSPVPLPRSASLLLAALPLVPVLGARRSFVC